MAIFTVHRVHVFVPCGFYWYDDSDYYNPKSGWSDIDETYLVFGVKEAWNLYRKEVKRLREKKDSYDMFSITIESALVPEGGLISGKKLSFEPGDGFEPLKELKWELLDETKVKT